MEEIKYLFLFFILILCNFKIVLVKCEYYSSITAMLPLYKHEVHLLSAVDKYISSQESKLNYLKEKLLHYEREHSEALEIGGEYILNPINNYLLNKRLTLDWEKIRNLMEYDTSASFMKKLNEYGENYNLPKFDELVGAVQGLIRIQKTYKLNTTQMADGELNGIKYSTGMSAEDCYQIGKIAIYKNELELADVWLSEALHRYQRGLFGNMIASVQKFNILDLLSRVQLKLGNNYKALNYITELLKGQPNNQMVLNTKVALENYISKNSFCKNHEIFVPELKPVLEVKVTETPEVELYNMACRGELKKPPHILRELHCGYLTETHPFLILAPIKVEELSLTPLVVIYYDVINDKEIEEFKEIVKGQTRRASVQSFDGGSVISDARTSQFAFFCNRNDTILKKLDQRVEDMTGLIMQTSEELQAANYGIGGHYAIHTDSFEENIYYLNNTFNQKNGNRIATVLFYMSNVEQGGATVFPHQNLTIYPVKGSAAFWYNLHSMGEADLRSRHGACPILVGSKWILNKWIRERGQIFSRPCELYPDNFY